MWDHDFLPVSRITLNCVKKKSAGADRDESCICVDARGQRSQRANWLETMKRQQELK